MKRIGNFLFVEQWFADHEPEQAIVNINTIDTICTSKLADRKQHSVIETQTAKIALTGDHDDNIMDLSELLKEDNKAVDSLANIASILRQR